MLAAGGRVVGLIHRATNPLVAGVLRSPIHPLLSDSLLLLTVRGRNTGRYHTLPVQYARAGETLYIVPGDHEHKRWWRNLVTPAPVRIRLQGRDATGTAQVFLASQNPELVVEAMRAYLPRFPRSARLRGLTIADGRVAGDDARVKAATANDAIVRIELHTMRAIVHHRYGAPHDVLSLEEVELPAIRDGDVLIRVHAAGISYPDGVMTRGVPYILRLFAGLRRPRHGIRGTEVAGTVTAVGANVADLRPGDEVFGWCGRSAAGGGFAEYARCPRTMIVRKPATITFEQAAALPVSGVTALQADRDWAQVRPGQKVLINGASGGVGSFAVQIAKALGAEVTGVCSTANLELVRSLGADAIIDYTHEDYTRGPQRYDAIIDVPHLATSSLADCRRALTPEGILVPSSNTPNRWVGGFSRIMPARLIAPFVSQRIRAPEMAPNQTDLAALAELVQSGKVTPVIDRTYPLAEVPEALDRFGNGHTRGKIVIAI
jgi:NADPH:quinone reductase-like Zn-dependent oxidoreductase